MPGYSQPSSEVCSEPIVEPEPICSMDPQDSVGNAAVMDGTASASGVEICRRRADLPLADTFDLEHQWLRTKGAEAGQGAAKDGGVLGLDTEMTDHSGQGNWEGSTCEPVEQQGWYGVDADCVEERLKSGEDTWMWGPTNTCHDVVERVLRGCTEGADDPAIVNPDPEYRYTGNDGAGGANS